MAPLNNSNNKFKQFAPQTVWNKFKQLKHNNPTLKHQVYLVPNNMAPPLSTPSFATEGGRSHAGSMDSAAPSPHEGYNYGAQTVRESDQLMNVPTSMDSETVVSKKVKTENGQAVPSAYQGGNISAPTDGEAQDAPGCSSSDYSLARKIARHVQPDNTTTSQTAATSQNAAFTDPRFHEIPGNIHRWHDLPGDGIFRLNTSTLGSHTIMYGDRGGSRDALSPPGTLVYDPVLRSYYLTQPQAGQAGQAGQGASNPSIRTQSTHSTCEKHYHCGSCGYPIGQIVWNGGILQLIDTARFGSLGRHASETSNASLFSMSSKFSHIPATLGALDAYFNEIADGRPASVNSVNSAISNPRAILPVTQGAASVNSANSAVSNPRAILPVTQRAASVNSAVSNPRAILPATQGAASVNSVNSVNSLNSAVSYPRATFPVYHGNNSTPNPSYSNNVPRFDLMNNQYGRYAGNVTGPAVAPRQIIPPRQESATDRQIKTCKASVLAYQGEVQRLSNDLAAVNRDFDFERRKYHNEVLRLEREKKAGLEREELLQVQLENARLECARVRRLAAAPAAEEVEEAEEAEIVVARQAHVVKAREL